MSLLLDALKKAADAKAEKLKQADKTEDAPPSGTTAKHDIEEVEASDTTQNVYALPNAEFNTYNNGPKAHRKESQQPSNGNDFNPKIATSSADAQAFFASKVQSKSLPKRPNLFLVIVLILFTLSLSGIVYFYYIKKENDLQQQLHQAKKRAPIITTEEATDSAKAPEVNEIVQSKVAPKTTPKLNDKEKSNTSKSQAKNQQTLTTPVQTVKKAAPKPTPAPVEKTKHTAAKTTRRINVVIKESLQPADLLATRAYKAYKNRDFSTALTHYKQAISVEPSHYDALLGLATVSSLLNDRTLATETYQEILRHYPNDPTALASLNQFLALEQTADIESELIILLSKQPDSDPLNFALGNFYSQKERWADAQAAYFKAYSKRPDNPDYAYNLAVSLDQLGKPKVASKFYKTSLKSAQQYPAKFDPNIVRRRLSEIR